LYDEYMTGNKTLDTALIGLLTLASLAALGVFTYTEMVYQRPLPSDKVEFESLKKDTETAVAPEVFKLDKLIVNLNSQGSRLRFLDVEIHLVPFKSKSVEVFENQKAFIKDAIIDISSNMAPDELNTVAGKVLLEERIRRRLNDYFGKSLIKEIFFSRFVVQ
jgi:flagellar FliL protein